MNNLTELLEAAIDGNESDVNRLYAFLYEELHQLARNRLRRESNSPLGATSLVHETYLRLLKGHKLQATDRPRFFAYAATVMRSIIVDLVRKRRAERNGGNYNILPLDSQLLNSIAIPEDQIIEVSEALETLASIDERLVRIVEMRYFAGFTEQEIAEALGVTDRTVRRGWEKAKLLLAELLTQ